jgi:hypothetical protein
MVVPVEAMLIIGSLRGSVEAGNLFIYKFEYFIVFLENTTYMGSHNYAFFYVTQFFLRNYSRRDSYCSYILKNYFTSLLKMSWKGHGSCVQL